ncbi:hypothetical protein NC661_05630 [Aquibacillus koreensis]|uniref:Uncharacterized protein n=1 Tax=Aquibacillus koreensis TaxID=279446 RepID=A0A9X3WH74_9BACI|nr:hypothetical protein [Aquibacillus koreensis]MCT2534663.1 hypothetical protein [Aquibacillus koreensis]MDC3419847.1 hypothetical protein [Aquibacillus koreensis]
MIVKEFMEEFLGSKKKVAMKEIIIKTFKQKDLRIISIILLLFLALCISLIFLFVPEEWLGANKCEILLYVILWIILSLFFLYLDKYFILRHVLARKLDENLEERIETWLVKNGISHSKLYWNFAHSLRAELNFDKSTKSKTNLNIGWVMTITLSFWTVLIGKGNMESKDFLVFFIFTLVIAALLKLLAFAGKYAYEKYFEIKSYDNHQFLDIIRFLDETALEKAVQEERSVKEFNREILDNHRVIKEEMERMDKSINNNTQLMLQEQDKQRIELKIKASVVFNKNRNETKKQSKGNRRNIRR